ncbi:AraC family transcriptional regulator [Hoeflea alexandrii]|uniref:Helix-turn-helix domain-containing protein n=1 Tax=Hoeflea alexandrii TaxID=288436 RepID=A0ABT1CWK0_9HYPH|nr:AraC family transcriptional regulator [Hoeflea alexandrii]MCO6409731.1 helix-turn-helix domain-containing protein [Hoeflea alexandrii]MCY0152739.1 AraC family transcriptional regulator [Hoeflea alexandrii]
MQYSDLIAPALAYSNRHRQDNRAALPNLTVLQTMEVSEFDAVVYKPVACLVLQGAKETSVGDQFVTLHAGSALIVSHDLPVQSRIVSASVDKPYLALIVSLEHGMLRSLYDQISSVSKEMMPHRSLAAGPADTKVIETIGRYLALMNSSVEAEVLGPSILREIHFRLLISPIGGMLRNLLSIDSHASRVAKAIVHIKRDFRQNLSIPELAQLAGMSQSSFHGHFKQVTGTTPLQYQKDLRMIAARDLLRAGHHSVASASFEVGYESPTHFSRDYQRKFGTAPSREGTVALEPA